MEYVGRNLTLPRLYKLEKYWDLHPPVEDLVAAYLDYRPEKVSQTGPQETGSLDDLMADFQALGGRIG